MPFSLQIVRAGLDNDAVQVVVNGTSYQGWLEIDIDSDILNPADAFRVIGKIPKKKSTQSEVRAGAPAQAFDDFREGNSCDVYVGLDRQMAGVIDDIEFTSERSASRIKITGRDKGAFLVDSEAKHIKASKYTVKTMIESLLDSSWGIKNVILSNEDNRKLLLGKKDKKKPIATTPKFLQPIARDRTKVDPGQRVATIIDTHCKRLGITWWLTAAGDLFIGKPNYNQEAAYRFYSYAAGNKNAKDNNVESWSVQRSTADRFSDITVVGQGWKDPAKLWSTSSTKPKFSASTRDPDLVERGIVRKQIVSDSDILSNSEAQNRADHEMGIRRLRGESILLTVPGFRQGDRLFTVDTIASVKIEEADIDDTFYVTQRRFTENRGKRRTSLTLHPKGVWLA
jgi:prophage tail gpP-like protein